MSQAPMSNSKSLRFNSGKMRWMLLPVECIEELVRILMKGAIKYADDNWKISLNTPDHQSFLNDRVESIYRHAAELRKGEIYDPEALKHGQKRPDGRTFTNEEVDRFNSIQTTHAGAIAINALFYYWYIRFTK